MVPDVLDNRSPRASAPNDQTSNRHSQLNCGTPHRACGFVAGEHSRTRRPSRCRVMDRKSHWETVYATKESDAVSWFQSVPVHSIEILESLKFGKRSTIIDIGGGDSTLVDTLIQKATGNVTVLDLSSNALERARSRLGPLASLVQWIVADVTNVSLPSAAYDVWHDRAVFHFLTSFDDRRSYVANARAAIRPGGHAIVATFAEDGPTRCSGLSVARYSPEGLAAEFGAGFVLARGFAADHATPSGSIQRFSYAVLERLQ